MANSPDSLQLALQYQKEGRLDQAEQVYRRLLEQQPDYVDALNLLGALIYQQGRFQEAVTCFEQVLILQPDNPDSYNSMGVVLKGQGNAEAAANYYRQALAMRSDQAEVHNNLGNALWQLGDLEDAIASYEQALTLNPVYPEAHNNLGAILRDLGRFEEALPHLQTAVTLKPDYVEALHNLGAVLQRQGKLTETLDVYRQALALKPNSPEICNGLGNVLQQQGEFETAIAYHQQAIALKPDYPEAFHSLANAYQQQKQLELAVTHYQRALALRPDYPEALSNYGNALQEQGKLNEAIAQYQQALTLRPNFAEAHSNLGAALKEQKQYDQAIAHFQQAIALRPDYAEVYNNLGNVYQEQDNIAEAIACYQKALELKPDFAEIHSNLGNMLQQQGEFETAFDHFQRAIAIQPNYAGAYNNLGIALRNQGQVEAAFQAYATAIELDPDFVEAHWNNALNYLLTGDLKQGFAEYEWRFKWSKFQQQSPPRPYTQPRWDGAPLDGKTIFLYAEQGLGDTIQFVRYISLVAEQGGRVILECQPQLISLLQSLPAVQQLIPQGSPPPLFDVHAPLLSLPFIFGTILATVPATVPYLPAPLPPFPTLPAPATDSLKIGIVWSGNPDNPYNRSRAVPLELLLPLATIPGIQLYSLQKQLSPDDLSLLQAHPEVQDLREQLTDFVATAALIDQLDLVISVDTAVTHLAGALAQPVWLLLPFAPDWRWLCDRPDSPWYPTLRLFRQSTPGDWTDVLEQVQQALAEMRGIKLPAPVSKSPNAKPPNTKRKKQPSVTSGKPARKQAPKQDKAIQPTVVPTAAVPPATPLPAELKTAVRLHQKGQVREAEAVCRQFLQQQDHPEGWHMLGLMAHQNRDFEAAIAHYQKVLALNPNHHDTCNNLAVAFHELERLDEAIVYYQRALAIKPDYADAHNNYANALRAKGRMTEAIHHYRMAIAYRPHYPDAYNNLGLAFYGQEDFAQAAECYRMAIAQRPNFAQAHNHLGNALKELGDFTTAAYHYEQAIALKPDYAKAFNNWGNIFRDSGDLQTATEYYNRAIAINANFAEAHWNQALTLLIGGDLQPGFAEYEWRWRVKLPTFQPMRSFAAPLWDGLPLNGKTIFLHAEQGMGDIIQFVRYVALVVERGGRVILECHPPLINLLKTIPGVQCIVSYGSTPPPFEVHAPLLSLPHILGTTLETVPATVPYLQVADTGVRLPEVKDRNHPNPLKIGIVWSGNPENPYNRTRACPLSHLLHLTDIPGLQFYSLQKDLQPADRELLQAHPEVIDLREQLTDFVHTAALINQLDLVISVDTAVTHLVGALAKPIWLLLPFAPDWRWLLHRQDSPWYPTMRLFRQPAFGVWDSVFTELRAALLEKTGAAKIGNRSQQSSGNKALQTVTRPRQSERQQPNFDVNPLIQEALQHYSNGQLAETERICWQILQHAPDQVETLNILGVVLARLGQAEAAIAPLERVLQLNPESTDAWCNLGNALKERGRLTEAVTHYQRAIALKPDHTDAMHNLTIVLQELDRLDEAYACCEHLLALEPHSRNAHYSFGYIQRRLGRLDGAIASYRRAIQLSPNYPEAHKNLGHALLLQGDLLQGFAEYEWRWQQQGWAPRPFTQPLWDGRPLAGQTILLHAEQGMGDTIQFIRYARLVKERGGRVLVECPRSLLRLLQTHPDIDQLIELDSPLPAFAVHAPLLSLPHILGTTLETIPADIPYLWQTERTQKTVEPTSDFKIGIVWSGNPDHRNNHLRSCQLEHFRVLADRAGISFYSLQKGPAVMDLQTVTDLPLHDWSEQLQDFADTAAAIAQLDLVITVDTAVAHVAGAIGQPVWLLLHHSPDWRWMLDRSDTPWYPTMRLFRQTQLGDWQGVFAQVKVALAQVMAQRQSSTIASETVKPGNDTHADRVTVGIDWQLDLVSDWGIGGVNLALQLRNDPRFTPIARETAAIAALPSLYRTLLETLQPLPIADSNLLLQAFGNNFASVTAGSTAIAPDRIIGLIHSSDTQFSPAAIAQAKTFARVITGSTWNADILKTYGLDPVVVPWVGIDPSLFHPAPPVHLFGDRFVIFSGGVPAHTKGHDLLLAAFQAFHSRHADALLVTAWQTVANPTDPINGNGHSVASDRTLPHLLSTEAWINLDHLPYPEWGQILRAVDVAMFPSRCEPGINPWAIATLACGIPTLLSANTGHLDLIRHNLAYPLQYQRPVKPYPAVGGTAGWGESDIEEIVETLEHIYTHRQEARCRGAIAADVLKDWTWHNQLQSLFDLLLSIHQTRQNLAPSKSERYINTR